MALLHLCNNIIPCYLCKSTDLVKVPTTGCFRHITTRMEQEQEPWCCESLSQLQEAVEQLEIFAVWYSFDDITLSYHCRAIQKHHRFGTDSFRQGWGSHVAVAVLPYPCHNHSKLLNGWHSFTYVATLHHVTFAKSQILSRSLPLGALGIKGQGWRCHGALAVLAHPCETHSKTLNNWRHGGHQLHNGCGWQWQ